MAKIKEHTVDVSEKYKKKYFLTVAFSPVEWTMMCSKVDREVTAKTIRSIVLGIFEGRLEVSER